MRILSIGILKFYLSTFIPFCMGTGEPKGDKARKDLGFFGITGNKSMATRVPFLNPRTVSCIPETDSSAS